ncbi:hypothetical protein BDN72DRAFT_24334 [Pluteus cervinus]|uniref:Uncharacterized protein n=1 Tax=Pluteus cervinus TaxID=181527 RepID=A0ACD3BG83_9AGAR|nr:hypothetical protein BDN72DRAFT_24334 [Pluteus cervinus]
MLSAILDWNEQRNQQSVLLLQSSGTQSAIPLLRHITKRVPPSGETLPQVVVVSLLYQPTLLAQLPVDGTISIYDWTARVLGYSDDQGSISEELLRIVSEVPKGVSLDFIIDSVDTLLADIESVSQTYKLLRQILLSIQARSKPSRLVLHLSGDSPLVPLLVQPSFCAVPLAHAIAHPPALLNHIFDTYLVGPPPFSPPEKFWGVFSPVVERRAEVHGLVYGSRGIGFNHEEMVVEIVTRGNLNGARRDKNVSRILEGWSIEESRRCELEDLKACKAIWSKKVLDVPSTETHHAVPFNLNLTDSQQHSRAQVPLPYAHEGKQKEVQSTILYDPDSADDIDDDDPDEDLNI